MKKEEPMATVLALTGDELSLASLKDILGDFGHTVVAVRTGAEALTAVHGSPIDLFLIDILEEGCDPQGLTAAALAQDPAPRVVAVTAYPRAPLSLSVLAAGAHSLMRKPFEIGKILALLGEPAP